ncbi:hypothetical protein Q9966_012390 [Columba livia]|nr:hypothetical protein Q9966_012390 [Columba livia]
MHLVTQSQPPYLPHETTCLARLALPRQGEGLVLSLVMAVVSLQRRLSPGISTVKEIITLKKKRLFTILVLMLAGALGAAIDLQRSSSRCTGFSSVFWFLCDPPELGTFVQNGNPRAFQLLKLGIRSNWGKRGYTCIYRVQVHGKIVGASADHQTHVDTLPE